MRHCNGRLFDGSACNNPMIDCADCGVSGCRGDGCESQGFTSASCDGCGSELSAAPALAMSA